MEKLAKQKKENIEKLEKERLEKEEFEKERLAKEELEKEILTKEELLMCDIINENQSQIEDEFKPVILVKTSGLQKRLEKEKIEKFERIKKEKINQKLMKKERLEQERLVQEKLEQDRLEKERLEQEQLEKERLEQERLEQEKLEQELLVKEKLEQERLEQERLEQEQLEKERLVQEKLEKERLEQERLEQERLEQESLVKEKPIKNKKLVLKSKNNNSKMIENILQEKENNRIIIENVPSIVNKPLYYSSNEIDLQNSQHNIYFIFIYYMNMINPIIANEILYSQSSEHFNQLLFTHRFYVMYAIDILVINSPSINHLKSIIDSQKEKGFPISAIYGSYLPLIYSFILNEIGFIFNAFGSNINHLDKLKDYDTLVLKLLDDYNETHYNNEFIREQSFLIGYNSVDGKPITKTKIQSSSIHNLICHCWDLNYTSAILLYEDNKQPYIIRNPDFTEFLFGQQPIQLLFGKNETNLYNCDITRKRLEKAFNTWY